VAGACVHTPDDENFCTDGDVCTTDACASGTCTVLSTADCSDGDVCTDDSCHPVIGCLHSFTNCDDHNPCTTEECVAAVGCTYTPLSGGACPYSPEECLGGICEVGNCRLSGPLNCADATDCTDDFCQPGVGCVYVENDGNCPYWPDPQCAAYRCHAGLGCQLEDVSPDGSCNDGNACTRFDGCIGRHCLGFQVECHGNDGNLCTINDPVACHPVTGCRGTPSDALCDDGDPCTIDSCGSSTCEHTAVPAPGTVGALRADPDDVTMRWDPAGSAPVYDVIRGTLSDLPIFPPAQESCLFSNRTETYFVDTTTPSSGVCNWYLVRSENSCNTTTWGWSFFRGAVWNERISGACP
jgi:hypothetical protein